METFDAIVIGTGGVGSAALYHLAKRGLRVLGIDQFSQAHDRGSSHGQSRIIRQAYFEHPSYVPLLLRAYALWHELEEAAGSQLFHQVGLLEVGPRDGVLIPGVLESAQQHSLPLERLSNEEARRRFPFAIDETSEVVFEPTGGYLLVERCVEAHLALATRLGAQWRQEKILQWKALPGSNGTDRIEVDTTNETYETERVVIAGGAWSAQLLDEIGVPLRVVPKVQYWFEPSDAAAAKNLPVYFFETDTGCFYGFPRIDAKGLKVAQHTGGQPEPGPVDLDRVSDPQDYSLVRQFVERTVSTCSSELKAKQACMYTCSPDDHFILDRYPGHPGIAFAAGLSGHGFKFATVLGELLAEMVMGHGTEADSAFLRLDRFSAA